MFTKTQLRIMQLFVSKIAKRFTLRGVAKELRMHQALVYRASQELIKEKFIHRDEGSYMLNYKENHQDLAYVEHTRSQQFLNNRKTFALCAEEIIEKFPFGYFVFSVFGSAVERKNPRDLDILFIIERTDDIEVAERALNTILQNYTLKFHSLVISFESAIGMLRFRDEKNILNEVLNKHLIIYGSELFYRLVSQGRK